MATGVRAIEVKLGSLEDKILKDLGYREYNVSIGGILIEPSPLVEPKPLRGYSDSQLRGFADSLGGQGNPITLFKIHISREIDEGLIRSFNYWMLERDGFNAQCLPVEIRETDSRYLVTVGVIKSGIGVGNWILQNQSGTIVWQDSDTFWVDDATWTDTL